MGSIRGESGKSARRALIQFRRGRDDKRQRRRGRNAGRLEISEELSDALTARIINRAFGTTYRPEEIGGIEDAALDEMVAAAQILDSDSGSSDNSDG